MEDGHSAESHEISIFQFLIIELWLIDTPGFSSVSPTKKNVVQNWSNLQKICAMS